MKNITLSLSLVAIICLVGYILFLQECKRTQPDPCPPEGYVLISEDSLAVYQATIDYLKEHPDTIREIITIKGDPILIQNEIPESKPVPPDLNHYRDSLVNDSINVWVDVMIQGLLKDWRWTYVPMRTEIIKTVDRPVPVLVPQEKKILINEREIYAGLQLGGSKDHFLLGANLDYQNKKYNMYGIGVSRLGDQTIYEFRFSTKILHW